MITFDPLVRLMKERKINKRQLGEMIGLSDSRVSHIILMRSVPQTIMVERICNALEVGIEDVIDWREDEIQ